MTVSRPYKKIVFNGQEIRIYRDAHAFANTREKPFGTIPKDAELELHNCSSTGYTMLEDRIIRVFVEKGCSFEDLLGTVSHEMGHLVEGGFKKNPPNKIRYFKRHEVKAEHYENFALNAYKLTNHILSICGS
jgi:hypothetical protein